MNFLKAVTGIGKQPSKFKELFTPQERWRKHLNIVKTNPEYISVVIEKSEEFKSNMKEKAYILEAYLNLESDWIVSAASMSSYLIFADNEAEVTSKPSYSHAIISYPINHKKSRICKGSLNLMVSSTFTSATCKVSELDHPFESLVDLGLHETDLLLILFIHPDEKKNK